MINNNYICVFDLETDGKDTKKCNIIQIAAVIVHPRRLEMMPEGEFSSYMQPEEFTFLGREEYYKKYQEVIDTFHCLHLKITKDEFLDLLEEAPPEKTVWKDFVSFVKSWKIGNSKFSAPIMAGHNIVNYDRPILNRYAVKYKNASPDGECNFFTPGFKFDLMDLVFALHENKNVLKNHKLGTIAENAGISTAGNAHEALKDTKDEALLLIKYLKILRHCADQIIKWDDKKEPEHASY